MSTPRRAWYEFFAGGGMARLGLGDNWNCIFSNDISEKKATAYREFFGASPELKVADVTTLTSNDLPDIADLVWASFPCQDLSLAGNGAGLAGERSGTFTPFWRLMTHVIAEDRAPKLVVLENVIGTLTSHSGRDFCSIVTRLTEAGYSTGALVIDAVHFLPQSRPRLFIIGFRGTVAITSGLASHTPSELWHSKSLIKAQAQLPDAVAKHWVWWRLPVPKRTGDTFASILEKNPTGTAWHSPSETRKLLRLMSPSHRKTVTDALRCGGRHVGTLYKRTRPVGDGRAVQRAEVRFDGVSGCLRTPVGGSSRQTVIIVEKRRIRTRLLSPREAARLMGLPDTYPLPPRYNDAYHLFGDGVAVPVVRWIEKHLLTPLLSLESIERVA
ncbi:MAG TPA: DNA cytosine methyltransferase [Candidatus Aquilonibacter sp.]|nr:DNA cytosine methyltransferase [Candidatus Aquilonibacter sp.]